MDYGLEVVVLPVSDVDKAKDGLVIFAGFTMFDFQRLRTTHRSSCRHCSPLCGPAPGR